jgi:hypothetical protein
MYAVLVPHVARLQQSRFDESIANVALQCALRASAFSERLEFSVVFQSDDSGRPRAAKGAIVH